MPRVALVGMVVLLAGILGRDTAAGLWAVLAGVLMLLTAVLVGWRLIYGALFSAGLWLIGLAALLRSLPADTPGHEYWSLLLGAGLLVLAWPFAVVRQRRTGSRGVVRRWSRRSRRNDGVASRVQLLRTVSRFAVRRRATVLRPSLGELSRWQRLRTPTRAVATRLARVGLFGVWSPIEDVTLRIGGPRTGKTGELAGRILDAQGAVIATSTRTDLVELTGPLRAERGPVGVFNPSGLAGFPSTVTFDPLSGCRKPKTATERAADLLAGVATPGQAGGDRDFWAGQARRVLAALLHAAALGGLSMRDVLVWVADPDAASTEVQRLLRRSSEPSYEADALQFLTTNERTRSSICATIMPALGWLTDSDRRRGRGGRRLRRRPAAGRAGDRLHARRRGRADRPAGHRADRAHRPGGAPAVGGAAVRPAGPAAHPGVGRGGADLSGAAGPVDRGHGRPQHHHPHRRPVPRPAAAAVRRGRRRRDPQQHGHPAGLRRHPRPRGPRGVRHARRRAGRGRPHLRQRRRPPGQHHHPPGPGPRPPRRSPSSRPAGS